MTHVISEAGSGSAVCLSPTRLLTCRHVIKGPVLEIEGALTLYDVVASGDGDAYEDDWVIIELRNLELSMAPIDPYLDDGGPPEEGEPVWLIGFPAPSGEVPNRDEMRFLTRQVIATRVMRSWPPAEDLVILKKTRRDGYPGVSGGAAVAWNPDTRALRLVGIASRVVRAHWLFFSAERLAIIRPKVLWRRREPGPLAATHTRPSSDF